MSDSPGKPGEKTPGRRVRSEAETVAASSAGKPGSESYPVDRPSLSGFAFDDFEIINEIGRGAMGAVYKAHQKSLDRVVAIKMLGSTALQDESALSRFLGEARAIAKLGHPNIIEIYQFGHCTHGHYFAMQHIDGDTLQDLIAEQRIDVYQAIKSLIKIALAVHYAHGKGIVHRDLKPANVMIDSFRRPVVMDFGIAKFLNQSASLTAAGIGLGTPAYMPPEQLGDSDGEVGPRSDVYSIGGMIYASLTGRPPFDEGSVLKTVLKVQSEELPKPVSHYVPSVPKKLELICQRCLAKKPEQRFDSAETLARALKSVLSKSGAELKKLVPPAPTVRLIDRKTGRAFSLVEDSSIIGRTPGCQFVIDAANVSKRHCELLLEEQRLRVKDLGSANGTYVNGRRVESEADLADGDVLNIGRHQFVVEYPPLARPG